MYMPLADFNLRIVKVEMSKLLPKR